MSYRLSFSVVVSGVVFSAGVLCSAYADQGALEANTKINGPTLSFDWPAVQIGVGTYEEGPTGLTIIHFKNRASVAVDVRGGAPGTVNTDALRNAYGAAFTDAIVFTGGSSYGEEAITAVATGLKDLGLRAGNWSSVAFVPGAVIYDFGGRRLNEIYPDKRLARAALSALRPGVFPLGAQGAGRMAMQGGYFGCLAHSGQGGAYRQVGSTKIAAFAVVNAYGAVTDRDGRLVSCNRANARPRKTAGDAPSGEARRYVALVAELNQRIADARLRAALSVNRELVFLYWGIGRDILSCQESEGWAPRSSTGLPSTSSLSLLPILRCS